MSFGPGTRLGPYEIVSAIGAGGMGEVYRARDTTLGRDVAIKVLPPTLLSDPDRRARFSREAQVLASLNHPNIAAIYHVEETPEAPAIVMELVEGETLAERLARGPIPLDEALPITRQIAEALEAAHEQGVIHRDLKPANIKVRHDGTIKVLDFGLAKLIESHPSAPGNPAGMSMSPTVTSPALMSGLGVLLGTAPYMAPEQARGKVVDKRADIWAFGCVLYEMLTGIGPFAADEISDSLALVLTKEPDWTRLPANTPLAIHRLLRRALTKDRRDRLADAADARLDVDEALTRPPAAAMTIRRRWWSERTLWGTAVGFLAIMSSAMWWRAATHSDVSFETRLEITTPVTDDPYSFAISPDGRRLVFAALADGQPRLWLRDLASAAVTPLPGTEGGAYPFWSPDNRFIGFFANRELRRLDVAGGRPETVSGVLNGPGRGASWGADDVIVLSQGTNGSGLFRVPASGGKMTSVTTLAIGQTSHTFPVFLPDGRTFLFHASGTDDVAGVYVGTTDSDRITRVTASDSTAVYARPGFLLFSRDRTLLAQQFNASTHSLSGTPIKIAEGPGVDPNTGAASVSVSDSGVVTYRSVANGARQLAWFDRAGHPLGTAGPIDQESVNLVPKLSPDGHRIAVSRTVQGNADIWFIDNARMTRVTFEPAQDTWAIWSPDGQRIVFSSRRGVAIDLYEKLSNNAAPEQVLLSTPDNKAPNSWSQDGRFLLYGIGDPKTRLDLWILPMVGDKTPHVFLKSPYNERQAQFSPDVRWVAYQSDESGRNEIYVRRFPDTGQQWQISTNGGISPRWRHDGKELYFIGPDAKLMASPFTVANNSVEPGLPVPLFQTRIVYGGTGGQLGVGQNWQYDVGADGRFLINTMAEESTTSPIVVIQNWMR